MGVNEKWIDFHDNPIRIKNAAIGNHDAVNLLDKVLNSSMQKDIYLMYFPQITLCALSCELYLKYIQAKEYGKYMKGHNLKLLFQKLSVNKKTEIKNLVEEKIKTLQDEDFDFDEELKNNSELFEKTRYCFEEGFRASLLFMKCFMKSLGEIKF